MLDETAEMIAERFNQDATILKLHEKYKKSSSSDRDHAFTEYTLAVDKHLQSKQRTKEFISAGTEASLFLSQVASLTQNKNLGHFATGLGAMIKTCSGLSDVSNSIQLISAASGKGLSLANVTGLLGGAGLVLAGLSAFSSLMNEGDNELGEALAEIHSAITGMWTEMQQSFQATWKMLEVVDSKLDMVMEQLDSIYAKLVIMEFNHHERFLFLRDQIKKVSAELNERLQHQNEQIKELKKAITSYLDLLIDNPLNVTLRNIEKTAPEEIRTHIRNYSSTLAEWLINTASSTARTKEIKILNLQPQISQPGLIQMLKEAIAPEHMNTLDIHLGLFKSLSASSLSSSVKNLKLINPHGWIEVFKIYCQLISIGAQTILLEPEDVQKTYMKEIRDMAIIIENMLQFLEILSTSEGLWKNLVQEYQAHFDRLKTEIEKEMLSLPIKPTQVPRIIGLDSINEIAIGKNGIVYARANTTVYRCKNGNYLAWEEVGALKRIAVHPNGNVWGIGRDDMFIWHFTEDNHYHRFFGGGLLHEIAISPTGAVWGTTTQHTIEFFEHNKWHQIQIPNESTNKFKCISIGGNHDIWVINDNYEVYCNRGNQWHRIPGIHLKQLSVGPNGEVWGIDLDDYVHHYLSASNSWEKINRQYKYIAVGINSELWCITSENKIHVLDSRLEGQAGAEAFEAQTLVPFRKAIAQRKKVSKEDLHASYLQLISFIKLLDPSFNPKLEPSIIHRLYEALSKLAQSGSDADLTALYEVVRTGTPRQFSTGVLKSEIWQEELWHYVGRNLEDFSVKDLIKRFKDRLPAHPLYQKLATARIQITKLEREINPALNQSAFEEQLKSVSAQLISQQAILEITIKDIFKSIRLLSMIDKHSDWANLREKIELLAAKNQSFKEANKFIEFHKNNEKDLEHNSSIKKTTHSIFIDSTNFNPGYYKEKIQQLCVTPNVNIKGIEAELSKLASEDKLDKLLNQGDLDERPLQLAIMAGRVDIVSLLLEHDAEIDEKAVKKALDDCADPNVIRQIRALIHFYHYLQHQSLDEDFAMGRTLGLIRISIAKLSPFHGLDNAIILIGKTGAGKSTLANNLAGVEYELVSEDDGTERLKQVGEMAEQALTSFHSESETYYSQILISDNNAFNLVDMPGFRDTRGIPWNIAGGLSAQLLSSCFKTVRALVLVCLDADLYDKRIEGIRDSFEMLGNIINERSELIENVLLVVNSAAPIRIKLGASGILKRIKFILDDKDLSNKAKYILEHLTEQHIVVMDVPSRDYRDLILARIAKNKATAFNDFNFSCYHKEAEKFKTLIARLKNYYKQIQNELNIQTLWMVQSQQEALANVKARLNPKEFVFQIEITMGPKDLIEKKKALREGLAIQKDIFHQLNELIGQLEQQLEKDYPFTSLSGHIFTGDILEEILQRQEQLKIVDQFFQNIQTLLKQLKLEEPADTLTPRSDQANSFAKLEQFWTRLNSKQEQGKLSNSNEHPQVNTELAPQFT